MTTSIHFQTKHENTGNVCTYKRDIEARSQNHCYRKKQRYCIF
jgi:hypothetical protein